MKTNLTVLAAALSGAAAFMPGPAAAVELRGATDRPPCSYSPGEKMTFSLSVKDAGGLDLSKCRVRWTRTGDDGAEESGEAPAGAPVAVTTSLDRPGFVRLVATLVDGGGKTVRNSGGYDVRFDGGAGVDVWKIAASHPEPAGFDELWARRKAELAAVPMGEVAREEIPSGRDDVKLYKVTVPCAGGRPATGYLSVPAKEGRWPARMCFHGYNESWTRGATQPPPPKKLRADSVVLDLSAHGFELGREEAYYADFRKKSGSNGYGHAFDPEENKDPETAYFRGMTFRVMRGAEYLKSCPEWDGGAFVVEGGSQGGLQAIWTAALVPGVTECRPYIPWCCDIGGHEAGRAHGDWHIPWVDALGFYDAANMASRIPATCRVVVTRAGLGDYICPPSGVMAFYNSLKCPKEMTFIQGSTHFYVPPWPNQAFRLLSARPGAGDATAELQGAFDDCFRAGGGMVEVEGGEYAVKGMRLRSGTTLLLRSGALLKASRNPADYDILAGDRVEPVPEEDFAPGVVWQSAWKRKNHDHLLKRASHWNNAMIRILRARDVRIVGEPGSVMDGCDCYDPEGEEHFRGPHGISAHESTNLVFRGYTLRNTGNWAHSVWNCADLVFDSLEILGGHDGVHLCSCDRVLVSGCTMKIGDDCVAGFDNEDVVVRGCDLNTACSAFRFGGRRVTIEDCRCHGPGEFPIRNSLTKEEQIAGSHGAPGAGFRSMLALFTYYSDFTLNVRSDPGEIVVRNCRADDVGRFLHYNFSGSEVWQKNRPLGSIRFENVDATRIGMSLCAYGDESERLSLALVGCRVSFAKPQKEFIRGCHIGSLVLEDVRAEGVDGPCVRSWGDVAAPEARGLSGVEPTVEQAGEPFRTQSI